MFFFLTKLKEQGEKYHKGGEHMKSQINSNSNGDRTKGFALESYASLSLKLSTHSSSPLGSGAVAVVAV
jgi:hypothetical protein